MHPILVFLMVVILLVVIAIILITLNQNTKSEGLGAAITGASDSYRGAVGVEEQKRRLLKVLCYAFIFMSFVTAVLETFL